jgi:hypothetical protein
MQQVTKEMMRQFILSQEDSKEVNMGVPYTDKNNCGCVMIHYGQSITEGNLELFAGLRDCAETTSSVSVFTLIFPISELIAQGFSNTSNNYGQLKASLKD